VSSLDRARAALAGNDPARALTDLDEHEAEFPSGALAQEATLLRIEALVKLGRRSRAAEIARAFIADHPQSPHLSEVRALVNP
jgi:outer membrane protein assembly factor BamD (BamD/ComL family)